MKQKKTYTGVALLVLMGLLIVALAGHAGNLEPSSPPGSTMKTLDEVEPRIPIPASSPASPVAAFTITQSGSYYLTGNRYSSGDGIVVNADDVTIDLMGYQLVGPGSVSYNGIYMNGRSNIEIRNGTVRDFNNGVYEVEKNNGKAHRVTRIRAVSNIVCGIYLKGAGHVVKDCTAADNGTYGINCYNTSTISGNTVHSNGGYGIHVYEGNVVTGNSIDNNGTGIYIYGSNNRIEKNSIKSSTARGLYVNDNKNIVGDNTVIGNNDNYDIAADNQLNILLCEVPESIDWPAMVTLSGTLTCASTSEHAITITADDVTIDLGGHTLIGPGTGICSSIHMDGRSNVEIRNGTVRDFYYGIHENSNAGHDHRVIDVRAMSNTQSGIYLDGSGHLVKNCTASNNGISAAGSVYGIYAYVGSTVTGNTVYWNGTSAGSVYGISAGIGSTVTGNTANENGRYATGSVCGIRAGNGSTATGNTANENGDDAAGIVYGIRTAYGCTVTGNTANENGANAAGIVYGIYAYSGSTVTSNTAQKNGDNAGGSVYGIHAGTGSTMTGNTVNYNGDYATGSAVYGIYANQGSTVTGNSAHSNGTLATGSVYGIHAGSGSTVTGNTANTNGNSATGSAYGIYLGAYNLADQNTAYSNGTKAGSATNMTLGKLGCVYGINVAP